MIALNSHVEVLIVDDDGLALHNGELLRLGPVSCAIVEFLDEPRSLEALVVHLESQFGAPTAGSVHDAVVGQLVDLRSHGIVTDDGDLPTTGP